MLELGYVEGRTIMNRAALVRIALCLSVSWQPRKRPLQSKSTYRYIWRYVCQRPDRPPAQADTVVFGRSIMTLSKRLSAVFIAASMLLAIGCASTSTRESTGEYIDDSTITSKVKAAIFNEPSLKGWQINVETYKSVVQLSGFVNSSADITTAGSVARSVKGVVSVKNDILLK
jgi:hyperosmotically inducible protein